MRLGLPVTLATPSTNTGSTTPDPSAGARGSNLDRLTSLRFFAALLVVIHHGTLELGDLPIIGPLARPGYVGVTFFFILSGFVLTWSGSPRLSARHFYGRRFARIYPTHIATFVIALLLCASLHLPVGVGPAVSTAVLVQPWIPLSAFTDQLNNVSWSLGDEAFFYALFPFILSVWLQRSSRRIVHHVAAVLVVVILLAVVVRTALPAEIAGNVVYKVPMFRVGEFLVGMLLAILMRRGWRCPLGVASAAALTVGAYVLMATALAVTDRSGLIRIIPDLLMVLPFSLLIVAAATADLAPARSGTGLDHPRLVLLGKASFQLYMTHYLVLIVLREALGRLDLVEQVAWMAGFVAIAVVVSLLCYRGFEVPTERWLRARLGGPRRQNRTETRLSV